MTWGGEEWEVLLGIGEYHATTRPTQVRTLLGSCISLTMHHPGRGFGAICHASLPVSPRGQGVDYRCVDQVIPTMLHWFARHKIPRAELVIKLFGGGELYGLRGEPRVLISVGRQNLAMARKVLREEGLSLAASDVGGPWGRSLVFHTASGQVWVRRNSSRGQVSPSPVGG